MGSEAAATGIRSTAIGNLATASGVSSLALGNSTDATMNGAVAIGTDATSIGAQATAINDFVLGTASHNVKVPGTLTVAGVPVNVQDLAAGLEQALAQIAELKNEVEALQAKVGKKKGRFL